MAFRPLGSYQVDPRYTQGNGLGQITKLARAVNKVTGASDLLKGLAGATTGMHSVRNPRDLVGREVGAATALASMAGPEGKLIALAPGSSYRRKLMQKLGGTIPARMALNKADASMVLMKNDRPGEDFLKLFRPFEGEARPGKRYVVPATNKHGVSVSDRIAVIQDPKTGTMFAAPNVLHGDLMDFAADNVPGMPQSYTKWFQHELYNADPALNVPARLMHGINPDKDTELATYARAKLIGKLKTGKATKAPSYKERLAPPGANKAMADMLADVLKRGAKHKQR